MKTVEKPENLKNNIVENKGIEEKFDAPIESVEKIEPIKMEKNKVTVMGIEIPRNPEPGPRTPSLDKFKKFIYDEFSLSLLQKLAKGIALNDPTLIEGETAIGKSFAIEFLAALTNQEVYRMSLNGQTDTTDLIGKWIPNTKEGQSEMEYLYKHPEKCVTDEARELIKKTKIDITKKEEKESAPEKHEDNPSVGLSKKDSMKIAELERISVSNSDWIWQDGEVPLQIQNAAWTVLDEVNTCEPQILTRLNSILEEDGELVLHEDGSKIPKSKYPDKTHMLFATVNPPGGKYRGRVPLSAEWISRWNYQNMGELPLETAVMRAKLRNGCEVELDREKMEQKFLNPEPLGQEIELTDIFGEEWTADFCEKYMTAFYNVQKLINKGEIAQDQEQKFDYDQRSWIRFEKYIRCFHEAGNMKSIIEDAIDYVMLGKIKSEKDRKKVKRIVLDLIRVSEPKEKIPDNEKRQKVFLNSVKTDLLDMGLPDEHKKAIFEKIAS